MLSFELDVMVFVASVTYSFKLGHALSTYGEQVIVLFQNVVLVLLAYAFAAHVEAAARGRVRGRRVRGRARPITVAPLVRLHRGERRVPRAPDPREPLASATRGQLSGTTLKLNALGALVRFLTTALETA